MNLDVDINCPKTNYRKSLGDLRLPDLSPESSPPKFINNKLLPYFYAQNFDIGIRAKALPFIRKTGETDLLNNTQANQLRSYSNESIL